MGQPISYSERSSILAPARFGQTIAFIGTADFAPSHETRAIHIGTSGNLSVVLQGQKDDGTATVLTFPVVAGETLALQIGTVVYATTTASGLTLFW